MATASSQTIRIIYMENLALAQSLLSAQTWTVAGEHAGRYKGDGTPLGFDVTKRGR